MTVSYTHLVAKDLYQPFIHKGASQKELLLVSRITVLMVALIAIFLASDPNSYIFQIVSYAWAGFGACFGPAILLSLYWKRMTLHGAYAGVLVGGITVLIWRQFQWLGLYELVPGFLLSALSIIVVLSLIHIFSKTGSQFPSQGLFHKVSRKHRLNLTFFQRFCRMTNSQSADWHSPFR